MELYTSNADSFLAKLSRKMKENGLEFEQFTENPHMIDIEIDRAGDDVLIHFQAQTQANTQYFHSGMSYPRHLVEAILKDLEV